MTIYEVKQHDAETWLLIVQTRPHYVWRTVAAGSLSAVMASMRLMAGELCDVQN